MANTFTSKEYLINRYKLIPIKRNRVSYTGQGAGIKTILKEKKYKKAKWLSEESLHIAVTRREVKGKGEEERYTHLNAKNSKEYQGEKRKPSSVISAKK